MGYVIQILMLLVVVYIAFTVNQHQKAATQYRKKKDRQSKEQDDIRSYLELYQYFTGLEFREKRRIGWNVIMRAIQNPEYAQYLVNEQYIVRYTKRMPRGEVFEKFRGIYPDTQFQGKNDFLLKESEDRHKLDAVVSFYSLLAISDLPKASYNISDFYYDGWRPLLCWYAKKLEEGYYSTEHTENRQYSNKPDLRKTINLLDSKFYHPEIADDLTVDTIEKHPVIEYYRTTKGV
jgi:hypothetical protein